MLSIFLIGLALSMDAFSLSLCIGINLITEFNKIKISIIIGIMHFIMPLFGVIIGVNLIDKINLNTDIFIILIFITLALVMLFDKTEEKKVLNHSLFTIFILAISVSIDSFSIGVGLIYITHNIFLSMCIFALCSGVISYVGLFIGQYCAYIFKNKAKYLGVLILFILAIVKIKEYIQLIN